MQKYIIVLLLLALTGCQTPSPTTLVDHGRYQLETAVAAQSQEARIKFLVIHYTAEDFPDSLHTLANTDVSVHYLIPAAPPLRHGKPVAWQLVPESQAAWHAGNSYWRGFTRLNAVSVGIELENPGYHRTPLGYSWAPFSAPQLAVLIDLASDIIQRYQIAPQNVVAHSDIAPQRKIDPGALFPWQRLAAAGIGAWPDPARVMFYLQGRDTTAPVSQADLLTKLARYGYQVGAGMTEREQRRVISAFQMHFRPQRYDGNPDAETEAIVDALLEKYGGGLR
ncbi:N-acetylmuramoyl-L-alanine amidase [Pectobacteriaceae bacterium CE70]|nr:N-acetylmuramoyl-L-alanine amidase [Pectobacteriaceae bacterium CE70]WJY09365.1 N-acetylmuramoyl-L-alanine amidase [Pectobacteriaceae bacterium C80]